MTPNDLKQGRERLGLTQEEAAQLLGMSWRTYVRYARGEVHDRPVPRCITAAVFGVTQASLSLIGYYSTLSTRGKDPRGRARPCIT